MVGVLILVHQHVLEPLLIRLQHLRVMLQQQVGVHEQVVEVHRIGRTQALLIGLVDARCCLVLDVHGLLRELAGDHQLVLGLRYAREDAIHLE